MKKVAFILYMLTLVVCQSIAVPAHRGTVRVTQPDGSQVTIQLLGDEWRHFNTTSDGYSVVKNQQGYYVYAELKNGKVEPTTQVAHDAEARQTKEQNYLKGVEKYQAPDMTPTMAEMKNRVMQRQQQTLSKRRAAGKRAAQYDYNNFKGLVILVDFNDKTFSNKDYPAIAYDMFNQEGYEGYEDSKGVMQKYTGSVRDYFTDNSSGKFKPEFDIYGPYTIDYSQYDAQGADNAAELIYAAVNAADKDIDFSDYDRDGDGVVDMIYFIFAGNGANFGGNDSRLFWPHRSVVYNPNNYRYVKKDNVYLNDYASSVELYGWTAQPSTVTIDGIGTICHEFSHVLGLPDFYDVDYEENGLSNHPELWSLMAYGSYNNKSRTPVGYSLYERYSVGFADEPQKIEGEGSFTLDPLYSSNKGYRIDTPEANEFFLLENRQREGFKWDSYLPGSGMLVHRVDLSNQSIWNGNTINNNPNRNYYEVVRADGLHEDTFEGEATYSTGYDVFPGKANVTELSNSTSPASLNSWSGEPVEWGLTGIKMADGVISFEVENAYVLQSLTLPESATVVEGMKKKLDLTVKPNIDGLELSWESDNPAVATVDQEGNVTGVGTGSCHVTVTGDNNISSTCLVTVVSMDVVTIGELKNGEMDNEVLLKLIDAEVLYNYTTRVYVRDATGAITLNNLGLTVKPNDRLNGIVHVKLGSVNNMPQAMKSDNTDATGVSITAGDPVEPREVSFESLSEEDYSDFVVVRAVKFEKMNGLCYAVSGDKKVRVYQKFGASVASIPANYSGKYYDVKAIFGTDRVSGALVDEFYLMETPVEVEAPTAINAPRLEKEQRDVRSYDLKGQPVTDDYKGIVIKKGKKFVKK